MDSRFGTGPLRAFRDRYVAPFAGVSYDLAPGALGVHPEHVARVPELVGREVLVTADGRPPGPLSSRPAFQVVALDRLMRNALDVAENGLVFSVYDLDDPSAARVLATLEPGSSLFLNSALWRLPTEIVRRPNSAA